MSLVAEHKFPLHVVEVMLVFLNTFLLFLFILFTGLLSWLDLLQQVFVASEQLLGVDLAYLAQWDVRDLVFEAAVDVHEVVGGPARVAEPLH